MGIAISGADADRGGDDATDTGFDREAARLDEARVKDERCVVLAGWLLLDPVDHRMAADLFLTIEHDRQVDRQGAFLCQSGCAREQGMKVALVVARTTGIDRAIADRGLERRCRPVCQRRNRLHVVMAIEQDLRSVARRRGQVANDEWVDLGWEYLSGAARRDDAVADPLGGGGEVLNRAIA